MDRQSMSFALDLGSYDDVTRARREGILAGSADESAGVSPCASDACRASASNATSASTCMSVEDVAS